MPAHSLAHLTATPEHQLGDKDVTSTKTEREPLVIQTLGRFAVSRGGKPLLHGTGKANKALLLFKYLLSQRGKVVPRDVVLELFWPDGISNAPEQALYSCVHRLRRALEPGKHAYKGSDYVSIKDGLYSFNLESDYVLDAAEFERLCQKAKVEAENDAVNAISIYREALDLYKGDYLVEHMYEDWVKGTQNYYRSVYREAVLLCTELQLRLRLYSDVKRTCEKVLELDPLDEDIHIRLLEALLHSGKWAEARIHYNRFSSLLYEDLGASPSPRLRSLYQQIQAGEEERPVMDLESVLQALQQAEVGAGAFLCQADTFRLIYKLEQRRSERSGQNIMFASLYITKGASLVPATGKALTEATEKLSLVLRQVLRKGDVICQWNEAQFLLLLLGISHENIRKVLRRVNQQFMAAGPPMGVKLRATYHLIAPKAASLLG